MCLASGTDVLCCSGIARVEMPGKEKERPTSDRAEDSGVTGRIARRQFERAPKGAGCSGFGPSFMVSAYGTPSGMTAGIVARRGRRLIDRAVGGLRPSPSIGPDPPVDVAPGAASVQTSCAVPVGTAVPMQAVSPADAQSGWAVCEGRFAASGRSGEEQEAGATPSGPEGPRGVLKNTLEQSVAAQFGGAGRACRVPYCSR